MKVIFFIALCFLLYGCSSDHMVEITYLNRKVDTIMTNAHHFSLSNGKLTAVRSVTDGDNVSVADSVRFYRIIK